MPDHRGLSGSVGKVDWNGEELGRGGWNDRGAWRVGGLSELVVVERGVLRNIDLDGCWAIWIELTKPNLFGSWVRYASLSSLLISDE